MGPRVRFLLSLLLACGALFVAARPCPADDGPAELAAGLAAQAKSDLAAARAHFEVAARSTDDRTAADALYYVGELDDLALDFPAAVAHYEASAERLASGRHAARALRRASDLRANSEGGYRPLVALETVRRSPSLANDGPTIDRLARDADGFPPGRVRVDAWMLAAEAYEGRLGRLDDALPLLHRVAADPKAEVTSARSAASELLAAYTARRDYAAALAVVREFRHLLPSTAERDVKRLQRRAPLRVIAWSDLALLVLFAVVAMVRPTRRYALRALARLAPMALLFAALASGVGGALASRYDQSNPYPFTAMLPAIFLVALVARAWGATGSALAPARIARAAVSFVGVFSAAFLLLDRMDPVYLGGFGL